MKEADCGLTTWMVRLTCHQVMELNILRRCLGNALHSEKSLSPTQVHYKTTSTELKENVSLSFQETKPTHTGKPTLAQRRGWQKEELFLAWSEQVSSGQTTDQRWQEWGQVAEEQRENRFAKKKISSTRGRDIRVQEGPPTPHSSRSEEKVKEP